MKRGQKQLGVVLIVSLFVILLSMSFVSAGFVDWVKDLFNIGDDSGLEGELGSLKAGCTDSDGGINIFEKGIVTWYNIEYKDFCVGTSAVDEYYCENNLLRIVYKKCDDGCVDGACVGGVEEDECTDSDGGENIYEKGTTNWGSSVIEDSCIEGRLDEGFCHEDGVGGSTLVDCTNGCEDGQCVPMITGTCTDSDESPENYYEKGIVETEINEYIIEQKGGVDSGVEVVSNNQAILTIGLIEKEVELGGKAYTFGDIKVDVVGIKYLGPGIGDNRLVLNIKGKFSDQCGYSHDNQPSPNPNLLNEKGCGPGGNGNSQERTYDCPNGCQDGACLPEETLECVDSDGGKAYLQKGIVEANGITKTDYCIDGANLMEYYCDFNGNIGEESHNGHCENGAKIYESSNGVLIEEDIGDLIFSDIGYDDDCGFIPGLIDCDLWLGFYDYPPGGIDELNVVVMKQQESFTNQMFIDGIGSHYNPNIYNVNEESVLGNNIYVLDLEGIYGKIYFMMWYNGANIIFISIQDWDTSKVDDDIPDLLLTSYLDKYPSDLIFGDFPEPSCTDYDEGLSYYVSSSCVDSSGGAMQDGCIIGGRHDGWLREITCQEDKCAMKDYECAFGCKGGACVEGEGTYCVDTDDGLNYHEIGSCVSNLHGPTATHGDACGVSVNGIAYPNILLEWYCNDDGACVRDETPSTHGYDCEAEGKICQDGRCITPTCKDSDGGKDYFVKGQITFGARPDGTIIGTNDELYDVCARDNNALFEGDENALFEFYCDENGIIQSTDGDDVFNCAFGCEDGACILGELAVEDDIDSCLDNVTNYWDQQTSKCYTGFNESIIKDLCSDPDGGENILKESHTFGFRSESSADEPEKDLRIRTGGKDSCVEGKLREHYCTANGYISYKDIGCEKGCKYGVCLLEESCEPRYSCEVKPIICPSSGVQIKTCLDVGCGGEGYKDEIKCNPGKCSGCEFENKCIPYGFRTKGIINNENYNLYCDIDGKLGEQKTVDSQGNWANCQNNYECESNACSSGECIEVTSMISRASGWKNFLSKIICKLGHLFNIENYQQCVIDRIGANALNDESLENAGPPSM